MFLGQSIASAQTLKLRNILPVPGPGKQLEGSTQVICLLLLFPLGPGLRPARGQMHTWKGGLGRRKRGREGDKETDRDRERETKKRDRGGEGVCVCERYVCLKHIGDGPITATNAANLHHMLQQVAAPENQACMKLRSRGRLGELCVHLLLHMGSWCTAIQLKCRSVFSVEQKRLASSGILLRDAAAPLRALSKGLQDSEGMPQGRLGILTQLQDYTVDGNLHGTPCFKHCREAIGDMAWTLAC